MTKQSLAQLFRDVHKIEAQVALLRLDLQAAGILPKTKIEITTNRYLVGGWMLT